MELYVENGISLNEILTSMLTLTAVKSIVAMNVNTLHLTSGTFVHIVILTLIG